MHIPDGFLSSRIWIPFHAISAATIFYAARRLQISASARIIPLMGVLSAFVLAAQLLNFPVLGGTSGHLVGGALLAILLGPLAGFLTMATVLIAQALFLQDGGLMALGANIFNIGAVTVFGGYAVFRLVGGRGGGRRLGVAGFVAGWSSMVLSAISCAMGLALSGAIQLKVGLTAMAGYHALIGIVEGGVTAGILMFIARVRPDLTGPETITPLRPADWVGALILVALPLAVLLLGGGSSLPDPLQRLLEDQVSGTGKAPPLLSPDRLRDYLWIAPALAGGAVLVFLVLRFGRTWRRKA